MSLFSHSFKLVVLAAMFALFLSCGNGVTIEKIVKNPRAYENKSVQVEGKVTNSTGIVGIGYFTISDGTNDIQVFTKSGLPVEGTTVTVKGRFTQVLKAGNMQVLAIEEGEIMR